MKLFKILTTDVIFFNITNVIFLPFSFSKVMQIAKILNVHMDSLQWIDQNSGRN